MNRNDLIRVLLEIVLEEIGEYKFVSLEDCLIIIDHVAVLLDEIRQGPLDER